MLNRLLPRCSVYKRGTTSVVPHHTQNHPITLPRKTLSTCDGTNLNSSKSGPTRNRGIHHPPDILGKRSMRLSRGTWTWPKTHSLGPVGWPNRTHSTPPGLAHELSLEGRALSNPTLTRQISSILICDPPKSQATRHIKWCSKTSHEYYPLASLL
jgi:hypothetical protein